MPTPHHPPSPPAKPAQWFVFGGWAFDITAAAAIIRDQPRETASVPVGSWARAYGLDRDPGSDTATIPLLGPGPGFNPAYAMTTELTPVGHHRHLASQRRPTVPLLIDGTHRLYKAHATGTAELLACLFTEAQTLAIRAQR